jgi:hypothetical protein
MKNYKKTSFFLLLSTLTINAYDTSGRPSIDDLDDQSGDFTFPSFSTPKKTPLEKEVEKTKPTAESVPKKAPLSFLEKQRESQKVQDANKIIGDISDIIKNIGHNDSTFLNKMEQEKNAYSQTRENIAKEQALGRYEKIFIGISIIAGAGALITDAAENAPKYALIGLACAVGSLSSYCFRHIQCAKKEYDALDSYVTQFKNIGAHQKSTFNEHISEIEEKLAALKSLDLPELRKVVAEIETDLSNLKKTFA